MKLYRFTVNISEGKEYNHYFEAETWRDAMEQWYNECPHKWLSSDDGLLRIYVEIKKGNRRSSYDKLIKIYLLSDIVKVKK